MKKRSLKWEKQMNRILALTMAALMVGTAISDNGFIVRAENTSASENAAEESADETNNLYSEQKDTDNTSNPTSDQASEEEQSGQTNDAVEQTKEEKTETEKTENDDSENEKTETGEAEEEKKSDGEEGEEENEDSEDQNVEDTEDADKTDKELTDENEAEDVSFEESETVGDIIVSVLADPGVFPEGATLSVSRVSTETRNRVTKSIDQVRASDVNVAKSYTFDIKVLDEEGDEIEPDTEKGSVKVSFATAEIANDNLDAAIYHISEEAMTDSDQDSNSNSGHTIEKLDGEITTIDGEKAIVAETTGFSYGSITFLVGFWISLITMPAHIE